nr:hypothetical protein [Tanacetum cinerariifolium]
GKGTGVAEVKIETTGPIMPIRPTPTSDAMTEYLRYADLPPNQEKQVVFRVIAGISSLGKNIVFQEPGLPAAIPLRLPRANRVGGVSAAVFRRFGGHAQPEARPPRAALQPQLPRAGGHPQNREHAALQRQPQLLARRRLRQLVGHGLRRPLPARSQA